jgi:hypothetical protein
MVHVTEGVPHEGLAPCVLKIGLQGVLLSPDGQAHITIIIDGGVSAGVSGQAELTKRSTVVPIVGGQLTMSSPFSTSTDGCVYVHLTPLVDSSQRRFCALFRLEHSNLRGTLLRRNRRGPLRTVESRLMRRIDDIRRERERRAGFAGAVSMVTDSSRAQPRKAAMSSGIPEAGRSQHRAPRLPTPKGAADGRPAVTSTALPARNQPPEEQVRSVPLPPPAQQRHAVPLLRLVPDLRRAVARARSPRARTHRANLATSSPPSPIASPRARQPKADMLSLQRARPRGHLAA